MEYYVIYDLNDNIICYLDNLEELKKYFPNYRTRDLKRRFKKNYEDFIQVIIDKRKYFVYKFC